jgi:N4-gp56 family major capsid protein
MPATENATQLADLLDPQVVADYIDQKLINAIRFSPLAIVNRDLVGRPGDTLTLPKWSVVAPAVAVAEGADIPIAKLTQTTVPVKVSKIGRAIEFTDEALLSGYNNDIAEEAARQVLVAINDKVETDLIAKMATDATLTGTVATATAANDISDSLVKFGEDIDGAKVIVVPAALYGDLRKTSSWIPNTEMGADMIVRGTVGMVHGCQVVVSNRLTTDAYIVKPGALALFMKRDTLVEFDRDKLAQTNYVIASKIFAPYVYDTSKLIHLTYTAA